jgi:hypothetical protein
MNRANIECFGMKYQSYILIENMEQLLEYHNTIIDGKTKIAAKELVERGKVRAKNQYVGHPDSILVGVSEMFSEAKNCGSLIALADLMGQTKTDMIKLVLEGKNLAINNVGGYFPIPNDAKIEIVKDFKYSEKDIRLTQYEGGKHWYAMIGDIEVTDEYGDKKWNTSTYANSIALKFLKNLNKKA